MADSTLARAQSSLTTDAALAAKLAGAPASKPAGSPRPGAAPPSPAARAEPSEAAPAREAPLSPRRRGLLARRLMAMLVLVAALAAAAWYALDWWRVGRFMVSTDDAYVKADTAVISAKVSGYVADIDVTDNQQVKAGDTLLKIDDGDYRLAVRSAQDKLATQDAAIARFNAQIEAQRAAVAQAAAQIEAAQADKTRADAAFQRANSLARQDFASQAQLDQARADQKRAAASLDAARAGRDAAAQAIEVLQAQQKEAVGVRGELETAKAKAERDLSFTVVVAPFDGVIGAKAAQQGQFVQPGQRLLALVPLDAAYIDANFKETQIARLKPGQKVDIEIDAFSGRKFEGEVASVAPASGAQFSLLPPDNATGNFTKIVQRIPVRIALSREALAQGGLRPGLSVVVTVDTRRATPSDAARTTPVAAR